MTWRAQVNYAEHDVASTGTLRGGLVDDEASTGTLRGG